MKNLSSFVYGIALILVLGCTSAPTAAPQASRETKAGKVGLAILHQSNRGGTLEPCGCHFNPYGGVDREANAVRSLREIHKNLLYVDAGNMFLELPMKGQLEHHQQKAEATSEIMDTIGLDVFAPGPNDLLLGLDSLKALSTKSKFKWVGTNLATTDGNTIFPTYQIVDKGELKIAVISATPSVEAPGLKALDVKDSISKALNEVSGKSDMIVLLSQLPVAETKALATQFPQIQIVVGADSKSIIPTATWLNSGQTLLVDGENRAYLLGGLYLNLNYPFKGFYSRTAITANHERIAAMEKLLAQKKNETLQKELEELKANSNLKVVEGGSSFYGELIKLDEKRYGKKNDVTKLIAQYKESVRKRALNKKK